MTGILRRGNIIFKPMLFMWKKEILFKITHKLLGKVEFHFTLKICNKPVRNSIILGMKFRYEIYRCRTIGEGEAIEL